MARTKALAYLRVSGRGQVDGDGFDRQTDAIERYAKRHRIDIEDVYRDEGVSGTRELADRDGLAALLDRLESNGIDCVLVERADRLARDLMTAEVILDQFRELGVKVIAADSGADLTAGDDDPTRVLIRQVLGAVAQFDKNVTVLKLRAARERKRRKGERVEGRKPFGFHPAERDTFERIFQLHRKRPNRERMSFNAIANKLNAEGRTTRSGKPWGRMAVQRIIERGRNIFD